MYFLIIGQVDSTVENDPVRFSNTIAILSFEQKKYILCLGPCQPPTQQMPLRQFPRTNKYSFRPQWYTKTSPDGSIGFRKWLSYSISVDKIFCIYCMLFGKYPKNAWTIDGRVTAPVNEHLRFCRQVNICIIKVFSIIKFNFYL